MKSTLLLICLLSFLPLASAPAKGVKYTKVHGAGAKITAVSADSISVESAKVVHTYKISSKTLIHLNGAKTGASDLRKGMHAEVTASQLDPNTAIAIEVLSGN